MQQWLLSDGCQAEFQFINWILPSTVSFNISSQFLTHNLMQVLFALGLSTAIGKSSVAKQQLMSILWHTVLH